MSETKPASTLRALLVAACALCCVTTAAVADEAGWKRAITAGEAAYRIGDLAEAGFAFGTALKNAESFGESDSRLATTLGWLAETYRLQGRLAEAEPLLKRALAIREKVLGPSHPSTHLTRHNLSVLLRAIDEAPAPAAAAKPPPPRQAEIAPLKEAARPVEVAIARPRDPAPAAVESKPAPAPAPVEAIAQKPKPEAPPAPVVVAAPKLKAEPELAPVVVAAPRPKPEPTPVATPPKAAPEPAPLAAPIAALLKLFESKPQPVAPKPTPAPIVVAPKPKPPAPVVEPAPSRAAPPPARIVEPRIAEPVVKPAPAVVAREPEPAAAPLAAPSPVPPVAVVTTVVVPRHTPSPALVEPAPLPTERARIGAQLASLAGSRGGEERSFDLLQRARDTVAPLALADAQALLSPGEALLSYLVGERNSTLVVVRRDKASAHTLDIGRAGLAAAVKRLRAQLDPVADLGIRGRAPEFAHDVAHQLYRSLVAPAASSLDGATHLFVVPDDALHGLPFSVLVTDPFAGPVRDAPEAPRPAWLARRFAVAVLPGETALRTIRAGTRASAATLPFAGFGDPQLRGDGRAQPAAAGFFGRDALADVNALRRLPRLPDSRYVLDAMADILQAGDTAVRVEAEATEDTVKRARLADYRVLAFGTYGLMAGEFPAGAEPGLVLTPPRFASAEDDGLLTASEVSKLRLDADLVVVTASSNAAADGTPGLDGLPRLSSAFLTAGSRSLMLSQWVVSGDSTLKLVSRMLRERSRGLGNAEALRRAMLALMNGEDRAAYTHPMYWAPFVIVGEGAATARPASAANPRQ